MKLETITIRPGKKYQGLVKKLRGIADKSGHSLNGFVLHHLNLLIKKNENKKPD